MRYSRMWMMAVRVNAMRWEKIEAWDQQTGLKIDIGKAESWDCVDADEWVEAALGGRPLL